MGRQQVLYADLVVGPLAPGASVVIAHGLGDSEAPLAPQQVWPNNASAIRCSLATTTSCTFVNDGTQIESATFRAQLFHTHETSPPTIGQLLWQGLGASAGGTSTLDWKNAVRLATTGNVALAGLGAIDGVVPVAGDRILVKNQAAAQDNGIYEVAAGAWSRAPDANTSAEVTADLAVFVEEGTSNADTAWVLTTNNPIVLGTTLLTFTQFVNQIFQQVYNAGRTAADSRIVLDVVRGGIVIRDAAVSIAAPLLTVERNAGTRQYLQVRPERVTINPEDGTAGLPVGGWLQILGPAVTGQPNNDEQSIDVTLGSVSFVGGGAAIPNVRAFRIGPPTYTAAAAQTITDATTLYVDGAPIAGANMTISRAWAGFFAAALHAGPVASGIAVGQMIDFAHDTLDAILFGRALSANRSTFVRLENDTAFNHQLIVRMVGSGVGGSLLGETLADSGFIYTNNAVPLVIGTVDPNNLTLSSGNVRRLQLQTAAEAAKATQVYISENGVLKQITVDADDSAGVGFSALRVPN